MKTRRADYSAYNDIVTIHLYLQARLGVVTLKDKIIGS